jgi:Domain of unknown function (DUF1707)
MASQHQRQPWQNQPWARDFQSMFGGPASDQHMRVSDAERQAVADRLAEHFSSGRLDQEEFDERVSRAMGAKTRADLNGLFDDLPESGMPGQGLSGQGLPGTGAPAGVCAQRRRFRHPVLLAAFVILVALTAGHVVFPLLWIGFLVVIALAVTGHFGRGRSHHHHDQHHQ